MNENSFDDFDLPEDEEQEAITDSDDEEPEQYSRAYFREQQSAITRQQQATYETRVHELFAGLPQTLNDLLAVISPKIHEDSTRAFRHVASTQKKRSRFDGSEAEDAAADHAQRLCVHVWESLVADKFPDAGSLLRYLSKLGRTHKGEAGRKAKQGLKSEGLFVEREGDDGEIRTEDNPGLYENEIAPEVGLDLSRALDKVSQRIATSIGEGMTYKQIGEKLGMSEAAISQRVNRMRTRFSGRKERAKVARLAAAEAEKQRQQTRAEQFRLWQERKRAGGAK